MKVGLLLGSFDPPHIGHVMMSAYALNLGMNMVFVVPCWSNPTKTNQTPFKDRFNMCFDTFKRIDKINVLSDDEDIQSKTTYEYLNKARYIKNPDNKYYIIVGSDIDISTWYSGSWILENFPIIKVPRLGYEELQLGIQCSSTILRQMIRDNQITYPYLNMSVIRYIHNKKLYL